MGILLSRFKKEKSSLELLESLQEEIDTIECDKHATLLKQKKYVGKLIIYSVLVYCLFALVFYFLAFPSTFRDGALYIAPLVIMPVIVFGAQRSIKWYFSRQLTWNTEKLADLRARKKKILDEVMDKETFRVAREILEKFAPDQLRKSEGSQLKLSPSVKLSPTKSPEPEKEKVQSKEKDVMNVETVKRPLEPSFSSVEMIRPQQYFANVQQNSQFPSSFMSTPNILSPSQKRRLTRPIPDSSGSRGFIDRLIEQLVGDGAANRYALICSHCSSHNGMALKEEFEFISFRCAYCGFPNPSRRVISKRNSSSNSIQELGSDQGSSTDKNEDNSETETLMETSKTSEKYNRELEKETKEEDKESEDRVEKNNSELKYEEPREYLLADEDSLNSIYEEPDEELPLMKHTH